MLVLVLVLVLVLMVVLVLVLALMLVLVLVLCRPPACRAAVPAPAARCVACKGIATCVQPLLADGPPQHESPLGDWEQGIQGCSPPHPIVSPGFDVRACRMAAPGVRVPHCLHEVPQVVRRDDTVVAGCTFCKGESFLWRENALPDDVGSQPCDGI